MTAARLLGGVCVGASMGWSCGGADSPDSELAAYRQLRGDLIAAETTAAADRGRYAMHRLRLLGSGGLSGEGWVLRPRTAAGCFPAVLLQNGREENADVIGRLPAEFGDVVVMSLDYPDEFPYVLRFRDLLNSDKLERPSREVPALFLLAARYLATRADVDTGRIVLAATSFAVPFATIAAAADPVFTNVALIYGAGDLGAVLAANLQGVPRPLRRPAAAFAMRPFAAFAPERFVPLIAPRPVVMVNGSDDPQMPVAAVARLYEAARPPKSMVWLRTGHLLPTDSALIRTLIDTALARLPALSDTNSGTCARAGG